MAFNRDYSFAKVAIEVSLSLTYDSRLRRYQTTLILRCNQYDFEHRLTAASFGAMVLLGTGRRQYPCFKSHLMCTQVVFNWQHGR